MIGIFDSGLGGLSVMRAIRDVLPSSDITYFGDIKNAPYGPKSHKELSSLTVKALQVLQANNSDSIISACNSVSAQLAVSVFDMINIAPEHLIEMIGPTVSSFRDTDVRIGLCATQATIDSGMYQSAFYMLGKEPYCIAIPELANAIETGVSKEKIEVIIRLALEEHKKEFDVMILACTHYPLVQDIFSKVFGQKVLIFDPSVVVAQRAKKLFWPREVGNCKTKFLISQESVQFRTLVSELFPSDSYTIEVLL